MVTRVCASERAWNAHTASRLASLARALGLILKARHHMLIGLEKGGDGGRERESGGG